ncbi:hypothetical protein TNCT_123621 [Trichonephila clavata]|uniref:Saposin B-type domain-containing protein n=1 Tax=Trichonephila clavata TaxID=2740835 RepID=A0A8X6H0D1_TRICU|nr:hypothetical protein TNCT_123621 [Trichonephila clavata]
MVARVVYLILTLAVYPCIAEDEDIECDVCISTLEKFEDGLPEDIMGSEEEIGTRFYEFCLSAKKQEKELCEHFEGMQKHSPRAMTWVGRPLQMRINPRSICAQVGRAHQEICDIKSDTDIEFENRLMKKSFSELKKMLYDMKLTCEGCVKKIEFAEKIRMHSKNIQPLSHEEL